MQDDKVKEIELGLQNILDGEYQIVPDGSCEITHLIKKIAIKSISDADKNLLRMVDLSLCANKGVTGIAEMTREIHEVDSQTQTIAAAAEELTASVRTIASSAEGATTEAERVAERAIVGLEAANNAQLTMDDIGNSVRQSALKVDNLSQASKDIGKIVNDIEGIAKQTKLLALNATIEAARAGEAGKGFSVVANEVKNLSSQTADATENIKSRIENLLEGMTGIVSAMSEVEENVNQGKEVIDTSNQEMTNISQQTDVVNNHMQEITGILSQQLEASQEVSSGISTIAKMSNQNVAKVIEVIEILEATETPIVETINELVAKGNKASVIHVAKSDHLIWMRKLAQMLVGRASLDPNELADHHTCRLGKWYDNQNDKAFTSLPEWEQLITPHRAVHSSGIDAAKFYSDGNIKEAIECIKSATASSVEVLSLLDTIGNKVSSNFNQ